LGIGHGGTSRLFGGEGKLARGGEGQVVGHRTIMLAGEFEGGQLERAFEGAEIGQDDLPRGNLGIEEQRADGGVGGGIGKEKPRLGGVGGRQRKSPAEAGP